MRPGRRGCLGRPWLFAELQDSFHGRQPRPPPDLGSVVAVMLDHCRALAAWFGNDPAAVRDMRKMVPLYLHGFATAGPLRSALLAATCLGEWEGAVASGRRDSFCTVALSPCGRWGTRPRRVFLAPIQLPAGKLMNTGCVPAVPFDPQEAFPLTALRHPRLKGGGPLTLQRVALPEGWLNNRDIDVETLRGAEIACEG